jgi:hypothetical protein
MPALTSTSNGELFECSAADIDSGNIPTTPLPSSHPFCVFWRALLTDLTTPGFYDPFIDAYVSIYKGNSKWRHVASVKEIVTKRRQIRSILRDSPPNIIIVDQDVNKGYGFHQRSSSMWPFICITKYFADRWVTAKDDEDKLALESVLEATVDHELGNWFFTLVRSIRAF